MTDIHPGLRARRNAIRAEAYRRAASWLTVLPREWRPLDALARQIAPALGREYMRLTPGGAGPDPTGAEGRKLLARAVLNRFLAEGSCDTHTGGDGRKTFARVGGVVGGCTRLPDPDGPPSLGVVIALRPLTTRHRRRVAAINDETGNPWNLPDPMDAIASPAGGGLVAVAGKTVVGYAVFDLYQSPHKVPVVAVQRVAVAAAWQRRGIGTILLQGVESKRMSDGAGGHLAGAKMVCAITPEPCWPAQVMLRGLGYATLSDAAIIPDVFGDIAGYGFCRPIMRQRSPYLRAAT